MKAVVNSRLCPLMTEPSLQCELADEALYGMELAVLEETTPDFWKVRTPYRYEGYAPVSSLVLEEDLVEAWAKKPKRVVLHKNFAESMAEPRVQSYPIASLTLGGIVAVEEEPQDGWQKVSTPQGKTGYLRASLLDTYYAAPIDLPEAELRQRVVDTALLYRRTPYRWGGKTPLGIDCSGLVSMAYLLNGIAIYRDAHILPDFPIVEIPRDRIQPADLIFFPGHVAMYMGQNRYLHSTGKSGSDGFDINSLNPADPDYRQDLAEKISAVGSYWSPQT